ncbi:hypothetical protein [Caulobacter segnis]|uniref:Uncharacterized protein n=1 Tax=Caulobacter segnis TaxID=88688 RepID=A0A2W5VF95_9CAUL|nr:hypothetical protein [Caulobacter segnis]PZR34015.1 MAG: hypothetical protein DI526_11700 [Caulobacter segnis]
MPLFLLVPFAVFFGCVLGQFYLVRKVRRALVARHPALWLQLSDKALFIDNAIFSFVLKKRDKALGDPALSAITGRMRKLQIVAIVAWAAYGIGIVTAGFR